MPEIEIKLTKKQSEAMKVLLDDKHTEILYGGSKGSGKTYLIAAYVSYMCQEYPGIRIMVGRTHLTQLRMSTIKTMLDFFKYCKMDPTSDYKYNLQTNEIKFPNGSEIVFKDLESYPSDLNFDSLGGLEITVAIIDEAQQVTRECYNTVKSLLRYKLNEFKLKPKILLTSNPGQNFLKSDFYLPFIKETLPEHMAFVQALPTDNPNLPEDYINILNNLPPKQRKRLFLGEWDYDQDDDSLFDYDDIVSSVFRNQIDTNEKKYMSVDVARFGADKTVCVIWIGLTIIDIKVFTKLDTVQVAEEIKALIAAHGIHPHNIIVDSDGIGGAINDQIIGSKGFVNNSAPLGKENFTNLKSQCYVKLSEHFKEGKISVNVNDPEILDMITQELLTMRLKNIDKDTKIQIIGKDEQKKLLGRSPDISDALAFRMYYEINTSKATGKYSLSFV